MTLFVLRRYGVVFGLFVAFWTAPAMAGVVYLNLVINPPTTAGFGVPTIPPADSTGTFSVTSNKSGQGSFHIYAVDDIPGSFGLGFFQISLTGNVSNVINRSPIASFDTLDANGDSVESANGQAGFSDPILRSGTNSNPASPVQGAQLFVSLNKIFGMGQSAGSFNDTPNLPAVPAGGTRSWSSITSGIWGNYATAPSIPSILGKNWLFLGEGNYTGTAPTVSFAIDPSINSIAAHYTTADQNTGFGSQATVTQYGVCFLTGCKPYFTFIPEANNVNASIPGTVTTTYVTNNEVDVWSDFQLLSFTPGPGSSGSGPAVSPVFDPVTHKFTWNTVGSPLGTYQWGVTATNIYGSTQGKAIIHITAVPEPATISLLGFALVALCKCNHRRR